MSLPSTNSCLVARTCQADGHETRGQNAPEDDTSGTMMVDGRTVTGLTMKHSLKHPEQPNTLEASTVKELHLNTSVLTLQNKHYCRMATHIAAYL